MLGPECGQTADNESLLTKLNCADKALLGLVQRLDAMGDVLLGSQPQPTQEGKPPCRDGAVHNAREVVNRIQALIRECGIKIDRLDEGLALLFGGGPTDLSVGKAAR